VSAGELPVLPEKGKGRERVMTKMEFRKEEGKGCTIF